MIKCHYCGRNNEAEDFCVECGTELPKESEGPKPEHGAQSEAHNAYALTGPRATKLLLSFLLAQLTGALVVGLIGFLAFQSRQADLHKLGYRRQFFQTIFEPVVAGATIAGGVTMAFNSRSLPRREVTGGEPTEGAWSLGATQQIARGLAAGAFLGSCVLWIIVKARAGQITVGVPTSRAIGAGWVWGLSVFTAVFLAPPVEELLFRGLLYGGYCHSFGPTWATVITTGLFSVFHFIGANASLKTIILIPAMALVALWFRLRARSVGPAVAVHVGYNAALAVGWTIFR